MKHFIVLLVIISIPQCIPDPQINYLTYQNIIILPDLSNRLEKKPVKDFHEIQRIIRYFRDGCVKPGKKTGDRSSLSFSTFSNNILVAIDVEEYTDLRDKQEFVNGTGKYQNRGLQYEIDELENYIKGIYETVRNPGLDLISCLIDKIDNRSIIKQDTFLTDGIDTTFIYYDNHIYIFTDGYLEYRNASVNPQFYYGIEEIGEVRNYCESNSIDVETALKMNAELCLPPIIDRKHQYITLHIYETHERDKVDSLQMYTHSEGFRDNEILEAVWRKWASDSGFKDLKWKQY